MRAPKYTLTIYDTLEDKIILENGTNDDVEMVIGLKKVNLSKYVVNPYLYKGRYKITAKDIEYPKKEKHISLAERKPDKGVAWWKDSDTVRWNNVKSAADGIKAGTHHIVEKFVNGKWVHVTEAK